MKRRNYIWRRDKSRQLTKQRQRRADTDAVAGLKILGPGGRDLLQTPHVVNQFQASEIFIEETASIILRPPASFGLRAAVIRLGESSPGKKRLEFFGCLKVLPRCLSLFLPRADRPAVWPAA